MPRLIAHSCQQHLCLHKRHVLLSHAPQTAPLTWTTCRSTSFRAARGSVAAGKLQASGRAASRYCTSTSTCSAPPMPTPAEDHVDLGPVSDECEKGRNEEHQGIENPVCTSKGANTCRARRPGKKISRLHDSVASLCAMSIPITLPTYETCLLHTKQSGPCEHRASTCKPTVYGAVISSIETRGACSDTRTITIAGPMLQVATLHSPRSSCARQLLKSVQVLV